MTISPFIEGPDMVIPFAIIHLISALMGQLCALRIQES